MTPLDWNSDSVYLSCTNFACICFSQILVDFAKLNTQNFQLNSIRENKYTLKMHKIHISQNTRKKYAQN